MQGGETSLQGRKEWGKGVSKEPSTMGKNEV